MGAEAPGEEAYAAPIYAETGAAVVSQGQGAAEGIGQRVRLESGNPVKDAENPRYRGERKILMEWLVNHNTPDLPSEPTWNSGRRKCEPASPRDFPGRAMGPFASKDI